MKTSTRLMVMSSMVLPSSFGTAPVTSRMTIRKLHMLLLLGFLFSTMNTGVAAVVEAISIHPQSSSSISSSQLLSSTNIQEMGASTKTTTSSSGIGQGVDGDDAPTARTMQRELQTSSTSFCCSFDFVSCGGDDRCDESIENCLLDCDGWYVPTNTTFFGEEGGGGGDGGDGTDDDGGDFGVCTTARWGECNDAAENSTWDETQQEWTYDNPCCGPARCIYLDVGSRQCDIPTMCCSWDLATCGVDPWCNGSELDCNSCGGYYINPRDRYFCKPLWYSCTTDEECCGTKSACLIDDNGWQHCSLPAIIEDEGCPHDQEGLYLWEDIFPSLARDQDVDLPANRKVHISTSIGTQLGVVTIPYTSELIIGNNNGTDTIAVHVRGLHVLGKLFIGSETCRTAKSKVVITLHGPRPTSLEDLPATYKGIVVEGESAVLSLHGSKYSPTWTRLAETAEVGDTSIILQENDIASSWKIGDAILLVTTAMKDSQDWHQNEVLLVASVEQRYAEDDGTMDGSIVYLQSELSYRHVAILSYQGEVGLLSRSIVIQGSAEDSDPTDVADSPCTNDDDEWHWGDTSVPCTDSSLTGFGGHVMVHEGAKGYVEGVEFVRMGQTNVLGRYPLHFHLLGDGCADCYAKDNSFHQSYYRCITIHGTNNVTVAWNVAYDIKGYCYYLEDGVEEYNRLHYNLVAHVHMIGPEVVKVTGGQETHIYRHSDRLLIPADVTASGFYIPNIRNELIGNAASGGWAGFAFPNLPAPVGSFRDLNKRPSSAVPLPGNMLDGNTAHSTAWWWHQAGAFYFGGTLYFEDDGTLAYNAGRSFNFSRDDRNTCLIDLCDQGDCNGWCGRSHEGYVRLTNSKVFLTASIGLNSWSGRMEIVGYECHDCGLSIQALASGFWITNILVQCRTGEPLILPPNVNATDLTGDGFGWYDTDQKHIITRAVFQNCGYNPNYSEDDTSGCGSDSFIGCSSRSSVFSFMTHSSELNPEIMQGTRDVTMEACGRKFLLDDFRGDGYVSVSGRLQNWLDEDGSVTGFGVRSAIASAVDNGRWWNIDNDTLYEEEGPLWMFKLDTGGERGLGHVRLRFDPSQHSQVGKTVCTNGGMEPCPALGYIKHIGPMFADDAGLPVTAQADIAGPVGGYGWLLELNDGSPKTMQIELIEVGPFTPLILHTPYPPGTTFDISASGCNGGCIESFILVDSIEEVRRSSGNTYHFSPEGLLSLRVIQFSGDWFGDDGEWILPDYETTYPWDSQSFVLDRFERDGVLLPRMQYGPFIQINASCSGEEAYCSEAPPSVDFNPCPSGFVQVAYDTCCQSNSQCVNAGFARRLVTIDVEESSVSSGFDPIKKLWHRQTTIGGSGLTVLVATVVMLGWT